MWRVVDKSPKYIETIKFTLKFYDIEKYDDVSQYENNN